MENELDPKLGDEIARLRDAHPSSDLWPHIARQLEPRRPRGALLMRWPTAVAAGIAIVFATSAGTVYLLRHRAAAGADSSAIQGTQTSDSGKPAPLAASMAPADSALADAVNTLEKVVKGTLNQLDPEARTTVTNTLTMLDKAIAQASERQNAAPNDPGVARYLTNTLRKKLQLLRTVSELTQRQS